MFDIAIEANMGTDAQDVKKVDWIDFVRGVSSTGLLKSGWTTIYINRSISWADDFNVL
jgi:hypothetical protein